MPNDRDTHFLGFADSLQSRLESISPCTRQEAQLVIARYAYDLIEHASECINDKQLEEGMRLTPAYMIECTSDLTQWPD